MIDENDSIPVRRIWHWSHGPPEMNVKNNLLYDIELV